MSSTSLAPEFVRIPDLVGQIWDAEPSRIFYVYAQPASDEITTITHLEFGRATHRAAHILRPNREGQDGEVVAVLALSDTVLYHAILVGLMTATLIVRVLTRISAPY
jgi:acyl-CoA synthetase (AMP-forming)/AMP-acid ligase II